MEHFTTIAGNASAVKLDTKMRILKIAQSIDRCMSIISSAVILSTTLVLLILLGINVAARYAFEQGGIEWIGEMPAHLFPWLIAAGIIMATLRGGHISVDFAFSILGESGARMLAIFNQVLIIAAYIVLFIVARDIAQIVAIERSPLLGISGSWGYYALMYAAIGIAICSTTILVRVVALGKAGLPHANPEESPL